MSGCHTAQALKLLLRSETSVQVWDYDTQFNDLWSMKSATRGHAIVVWADTPSDPDVRPVATESYVTSFDWAIAACSLYPNLRVTVVDLRGKEREKAANDAAANERKEVPYPAFRWFRTQRPECVPWLRRIEVRELVDLDAKGLRERLTEWPKPVAGVPIVQPLSVLRMLPVCHYDLSPDASHHAIANLVGPLLLLRNPTKATPSGAADHRAALRQLLAAAGLTPKPLPPGSTDGELTGRQAAIANILGNRVRNLRLVLCDDQWHHGWLDWLCERMGVTPIPSNVKEARLQSDKRPCRVTDDGNVSIWVLSSPDWLVEQMNHLSKDKHPLQRRLPLTTENDDHNEILLLDLRLFTGWTNQQKETFRKNLEALHESYRDTMPEASSGDSASATGAEAAAKALTLLPRTLALADPLLPIVVFSSTGKRDVIELLSESPSVVTAFAKPRLLDNDAADVRAMTEEALDLALEKAIDLILGRRVVTDFQATRARLALGDHQSPKYASVGVYMDESGEVDMTDERFVMAAVVAMYNNKSTAEAFRSELRTALDGKWGKACKATDNRRKEIANTVLQCAQKHQVALRAVAIKKGSPLPRGPWYGRTAIWAETALDRLHRVLLKQVVVAALAYVVRKDEIAGAGECSILTDIRSVPVRKLGVLPRDLLKFGIEVIEEDENGGSKPVSRRRLEKINEMAEVPPDWKLAFLETSGVYPIVEDAFSEEIRLRERFKIGEARACKGLFDGGHPLVEWADYVANAVFRVTNAQGQVEVSRLEDWASNLFKPAGIVTAYNVDVERLLWLARVAADGQPGRAVQEFVKEPDRCTHRGWESLTDRCRAYIADELERSYGNTFGVTGNALPPSDGDDECPTLATKSGKLYVGNISFTMTESDLKRLFERFGTVISVSIKRESLSGRSRGFGFVQMNTAREAEEARRELDGTTTRSRQIIVGAARPTVTGSLRRSGNTGHRSGGPSGT